jgi:hypothetical protein
MLLTQISSSCIRQQEQDLKSDEYFLTAFGNRILIQEKMPEFVTRLNLPPTAYSYKPMTVHSISV